MVNQPVTIGTINDYMHERNGQKQEHPQSLGLQVLKPALFWPCRPGTVTVTTRSLWENRVYTGRSVTVCIQYVKTVHYEELHMLRKSGYDLLFSKTS